jgi:putative FmdB family regulatory protein
MMLRIGSVAICDYNGRSPLHPGTTLAMPIYEYQPSGTEHCDFCKNGFDRLQKLADPVLTTCPECGAEVERKISAPNLGNAGPALTETNIEKHGFTQYRKLEKGVYEKTAGKGPDFISDD